MTSPSGPLVGLRVLDLGTRIGAPFAATLLSDLGADVIKVELPGQGDFMRTIGPFDRGQSLFWAVEGRGKRSVTLDLRKPAGQALLKRLVPLADVIVENFQPGTLESWGLGYDVLAALHPGIILTRVSVYGQDGPYRDRPGLDRNGIAMGGLMYITGYPDRPPVRPGLIVSDYLTGVFNAFAILSAIYERDRRARESGAPPRGQWVDLSLYQSILRIMEHTLATLRPARRGARARRQPAAQLGPARQLGDQRRQVRLHHRRRRRAVPSPGARDRPRGPARRPALRDHGAPRRARRRDQRHRRRLGAGAHVARGAGRPRAPRGAVRRRVLGGRHLRRSARRRRAATSRRWTTRCSARCACRASTRASRARRAPSRAGRRRSARTTRDVYVGLLGLTEAELEQLRREGVV